MPSTNGARQSPRHYSREGTVRIESSRGVAEGLVARAPRGRAYDACQPYRRGQITRSLLTLLILGGLAASGALLWRETFFPARKDQTQLVFETVKRGPLEITLTERGSLESANNVVLTCQVRGAGGTSILKIVDEGQRVKKDQVLVELDSSRLRNAAAVQQIIVEKAVATLKNAEKNFEIQKTQNDSDVAAAKLKLDLARLDLTKYIDGDLVQERNTFQGAIELATEDLTRTRQKYAVTQRLIKKGYAKQSELEADRVAVQKALINLNVAQEKRDVLDNFTSRRQIAEKEANAREFERELARIRLRLEAALAKLEADLSVARRKYDIEKATHLDLLEQIEVCQIRAPRDGLVIYANASRTEGGRRGKANNEPLIFEGAGVEERQAIIKLPDMQKMQINARIHESKISMVHEGLTADIHVDAVADKTFHGVVEMIALVPMSANRRNPNLREYATTIRITDDPQTLGALKPGQAAEVEIFADHIVSALQAPVRSFVERGGRHFSWILAGISHERREVRIGRSNDQMLEILDGLSEGEKVIQNPRASLPKEVAALEAEIPIAFESPFAAVGVDPPIID